MKHEEPERNELGLRAIVAYKSAKSVIEIVLGIVLVALAARDLHPAAQELAQLLRAHLPGAWSLRLADLILRDATRKRVTLTALALMLDGVLSALEGIALWRRLWWGPWLVVVLTGGLLPFELYEIFARPRLTRVIALVVNAIIVVYLAANARRHASKAADSD